MTINSFKVLDIQMIFFNLWVDPEGGSGLIFGMCSLALLVGSSARFDETQVSFLT